MAGDKLRLMIVAGEASGDQHAAKLVRALREASGDREMEFLGSAGPHMRKAGVVPVVVADELSVVGLPEIIRALPMFVKAFRLVIKTADQKRPDAAILVDFPEFNLKLAKALKNRGIPVIYYISPQLWAWRSHRIRLIRRYVDLMITILPFEKDWYEARGFTNVTYVGSPLAREVHSEQPKDEFCRAHSLDPNNPIIALLPGSRLIEITRILPQMLAAAIVITQKNSNVQFVVAAATLADAEIVAPIVEASAASILAKTVTGETYDALSSADAAAVTSGTATLEAAILGTPLAIVYKSSALNYKLFRPLISVEHFGLVNLIAGKRIAKEFIQDDLTAETLATELLRLMEPAINASVRAELKETADKLGHGGASRRAAEAVLKLVNEKTVNPLS